MKNFKLILKSLVNNGAVVEGGRKKPWYFAVIMLFLGMVISLIPTFVKLCNTNGSDFVNGSYIYGIDVGTLKFSEEINKINFDMIVKDSDSGHYLDITQDTWDKTFTTTNSNGLHCYQHKMMVNPDLNYEVVDFEVYYVDGQITSTVLNNITTLKSEDSDSTYKRSASYIVYGKYSYIVSLYAVNSTISKGTMYGDYKHYEVGYNFKSLDTVNNNGEELTCTNATTPEKYKIYKDGVWKNWKNYFNDGYKNNKYTAMWQTTLIVFAINFGLTIFMGLMIFILTRGKNNPFRIYTFWETQKIAYWAVPSPSIIGMILGFIISSFAQVTFPLVLGLRVMWLAMRTLRPENATPEMTSPYQKEERKDKKIKEVKAKSAKKSNKNKK